MIEHLRANDEEQITLNGLKQLMNSFQKIFHTKPLLQNGLNIYCKSN